MGYNIRSAGETFQTTITVPALSPGQLQLYDEETALRNFRKFQPFGYMHVDNINSNVNVQISLDYDPNRIMVCYAAGTKDYNSQDFRAFSVTNTHASSSTKVGEILVILESTNG